MLHTAAEGGTATKGDRGGLFNSQKNITANKSCVRGNGAERPRLVGPTVLVSQRRSAGTVVVGFFV